MVKKYYLLPASLPHNTVANDIYCCISHLITWINDMIPKKKYIKKLLLAVDDYPKQHNNMFYILCTMHKLKIEFFHAVLWYNSNDNYRFVPLLF